MHTTLPPAIGSTPETPTSDTLPRKRGEGTSCHHCKKRIPMDKMIRCANDGEFKGNSRKRRRQCVKKYCLHCIQTFYDPQFLVDHENNDFICPSCKDECRCAACRRRAMKQKLNADGTKLRAVHSSMVANPLLESKAGPDAAKIEEEQVNSLLEILESRPDVQDIIRKGMSLDFADENAKILYIAHLIDQALSRPDILAMYYAHTTGKSGVARDDADDDSDDNDDAMTANTDDENFIAPDGSVTPQPNANNAAAAAAPALPPAINMSNGMPPPFPTIGMMPPNSAGSAAGPFAFPSIPAPTSTDDKRLIVKPEKSET